VPRDVGTADVTLWMGPHGHVVHYLVRSGELLNIVAHIDSDAWTEESWTRECNVEEVMTTYDRWNSAHAMLPYLGRGAAMAIEDSCVLAGAIAREADNLERAPLTHGRRRRPRAQAAVLGSCARARENHLTSPWARLKRDVKYAWRTRFGSAKTVFETGRLYEYDPARELA
jgi:salicylate hydroxylase